MEINSSSIKKQYNQKYVNSTFRKREYELYQKYFELLLKKQQDLKKSLDSLLDLGCGDGVKTMAFGGYFKQVLGVDLSESGILSSQQNCNLKHVSFVCDDMFHLPNQKYSCISALGFSYFNIKDVNQLQQHITIVFNQFSKENTFLILSSFTDFSGNAQSGWVKHSKTELSDLKSNLETAGYKSLIVFPHRILANYVNFGFRNFILELGKLILKRNKTYFIILWK